MIRQMRLSPQCVFAQSGASWLVAFKYTILIGSSCFFFCFCFLTIQLVNVIKRTNGCCHLMSGIDVYGGIIMMTLLTFYEHYYSETSVQNSMI